MEQQQLEFMSILKIKLIASKKCRKIQRSNSNAHNYDEIAFHAFPPVDLDKIDEFLQKEKEKEQSIELSSSFESVSLSKLSDEESERGEKEERKSVHATELLALQE